MSDYIEYTECFIKDCGGIDQAYWLDLHYEVLYAKCIYYKGVSYGFKPMEDRIYDEMEKEYKDLSQKLNKEPTAASMVGWIDNPLIEAVAYRNYNKKLYESLKKKLFEFK